MSAKLTVIIPCKNEREHIGACVAGAQLVADEVVVADSGSTDGTLEIVRGLGCRIIEREYGTSGEFKNWAIPQAAHEWVFILDADERITPKLAAEIRSALNDPQHDGYWVFRHNHFMGHPIRFGPWRNDRCLRLFRRDVGRYVGPTDHAEVELASGTAGRLWERLTHYTCSSYAQYLPKLSRYAEVQAHIWHEQGRRARAGDLLLRFPLRFLQGYLLRLGFLDGLAGLQVCMLVAYLSWLKQAYLWQLHSGRAWVEVEQRECKAVQPRQRRHDLAVGVSPRKADETRLKPRSGGIHHVAAARLSALVRRLTVGLHPRLSDSAAARLQSIFGSDCETGDVRREFAQRTERTGGASVTEHTERTGGASGTGIGRKRSWREWRRRLTPAWLSTDARRRRRNIMLRRLGLQRCYTPPVLTRDPGLAVRSCLPFVVAQELGRNPRMTFLQIGAFDGVGDDDLRELVLAHKLRGVLVEPQPTAFARLQQTYARQPQVTLVQAAIAEKEGIREFFVTRDNASMAASFDRAHLRKHGIADRDIVAVDVRCHTVESALRTAGMTHVDLIQIDAEGYDWPIIRSIDFTRLRPRILRFEYRHMAARDADACLSLLAGHGYRFVVESRDIVALRVADGATATAVPQRRSA